MGGFLNFPACSAAAISLVPPFLFQEVLPKPGFVSLLAHRFLFVFFRGTQLMVTMPIVKTLVNAKGKSKIALRGGGKTQF